MFRVRIAGCRCLPVPIQSCTYLFFRDFLWDRLLGALFGVHVDLPRGMKPGLPVFTTSLSLCLSLGGGKGVVNVTTNPCWLSSVYELHVSLAQV
jgi:hypothetical protein